MPQLLNHEHAATLSQHKTRSFPIKWPTGLLSLVIELRSHSLDPQTAVNLNGVIWILNPTGQDYISLIISDVLESLHNGRQSWSTRSIDCQGGAINFVLHIEHACGDTGDQMQQTEPVYILERGANRFMYILRYFGRVGTNHTHADAYARFILIL